MHAGSVSDSNASLTIELLWQIHIPLPLVTILLYHYKMQMWYHPFCKNIHIPMHCWASLSQEQQQHTTPSFSMAVVAVSSPEKGIHWVRDIRRRGERCWHILDYGLAVKMIIWRKGKRGEQGSRTGYCWWKWLFQIKHFMTPWFRLCEGQWLTEHCGSAS